MSDSSFILHPSSFRVGLTGPIGAGKSLVASMWAERGAGIVEGDEMGRRALVSDPDLRRALAERFGSHILKSDGSIDRKALSHEAFLTPQAQQDLTRLTFPTLYRLAKDEMSRLSKLHQVVVFDAALIYEWGVQDDSELIVVVTAPEERLVELAAARLGIPAVEARRRLDTQIPAAEKVARADYVIVNDGNLETLRIKAKAALEFIRSRE